MASLRTTVWVLVSRERGREGRCGGVILTSARSSTLTYRAHNSDPATISFYFPTLFPLLLQTNLVNRKQLYDFHKEGWTDVSFVISRLGWLFTHVEDKVRDLSLPPSLPPSLTPNSVFPSLPPFYFVGGDLRRFLGPSLPAQQPAWGGSSGDDRARVLRRHRERLARGHD